MEKRINFFENGQTAVKHLFALNGAVKHTSIDKSLQQLIKFRVSQINKCAYCLDMHSKDARAEGETEQRLYGLSAWRETPYYTPRERAGLALAEAVTACEVSDGVYDQAASQFSPEELVDLMMIITTINTWNRINVTFPHNIGTYTVGQFS